MDEYFWALERDSPYSFITGLAGDGILVIGALSLGDCAVMPCFIVNFHGLRKIGLRKLIRVAFVFQLGICFSARHLFFS